MAGIPLRAKILISTGKFILSPLLVLYFSLQMWIPARILSCSLKGLFIFCYISINYSKEYDTFSAIYKDKHENSCVTSRKGSFLLQNIQVRLKHIYILTDFCTSYFSISYSLYQEFRFKGSGHVSRAVFEKDLCECVVEPFLICCLQTRVMF